MRSEAVTNFRGMDACVRAVEVIDGREDPHRAVVTVAIRTPSGPTHHIGAISRDPAAVKDGFSSSRAALRSVLRIWRNRICTVSASRDL
jgi:hypothetical protein